jgi:CheY-like chemotaxis protein
MSSQPSGLNDEVAVRRGSQSEPGTGCEAILVVDDNARLCDLAKRALSSDGWIVHIESSRGTALAAAASEPFALALSDYAMPDGDGLLLLSEPDCLQPGCRLVLWSAAVPAGAARRARELDVTVLPQRLASPDSSVDGGLALGLLPRRRPVVGKTSRNSLPRPGSLSSSSRPPSARAARWAPQRLPQLRPVRAESPLPMHGYLTSALSSVSSFLFLEATQGRLQNG